MNGDDGLEVLDGYECRRLLQTTGTGRVGFTANALPAVQPVRFAVDGARIVFVAAPAGRLAVACRGSVIVLQADGLDPVDGRTAWTVEVVGVARVVTDPVETAELDRLGVGPEAPGAARGYVTVDMELVRGWRVTGTSLASTPATHERRLTA